MDITAAIEYITFEDICLTFKLGIESAMSMIPQNMHTTEKSEGRKFLFLANIDTHH